MIIFIVYSHLELAHSALYDHDVVKITKLGFKQFMPRILDSIFFNVFR